MVLAGDIASHELLRPALEWFQGGQVNRIFVHPLDEFVEDRRPALWVHGHTHLGCDYRLGETRVVCNPYGYTGYQVNEEFRRGLVIEPEGT